MIKFESLYRPLKFLFYVIGSLVALFFVIGFIVFGIWQTNWAKQKTLDYLQPTLQTSLNEPIFIERFSGNLFNDIIIHNLQIGEHIQLDSIKINYKLLDLIFSPHQIKSIQFYSPNFDIYELPDSSLSILNLIPKSSDTSAIVLPSVEIHFFSISDAKIQLRTPFITKKDTLNLSDIQLKAGLQFSDMGYKIQLDSFEFSSYNPWLSDTLHLALDARADQNQISIGKLLLATTRSQFELNADYIHSDNQPVLNGGLKMNDLAWQDLKSVEQKSPIKEDLNMKLSFYGKQSIYGAEIQLKSKSVDSVLIQLEGAYQQKPVLTELKIKSGKTNLGRLLNLSEQIRFDSLSVQFSGSIPIFEPFLGSTKMSGFVRKLQTNDAQVDAISFGAQQQKERFQLYSNWRRSGGELVVEAQIDSINSLAKWQGSFQTKRLNLKSWLKPIHLSTKINSMTRFSGYGLSLEAVKNVVLKSNWDESLIEKTVLKNSELLLKFDGKRASTNMQIHLNHSELSLESDYLLTDSIPGYSFKLESTGFNLSDIESLKYLKSDLRFIFEGRGKGINPSTMQIIASARMDSSRLLGSKIDSLRGNFELKDGYLSSKLVQLKSDFVDARLSGSGSILNILDPNNAMDGRLDFKNVEKFAPVLGLNQLSLKGKLEGKFRPSERYLGLTGLLDLNSVILDSLQFDGINGNVNLQIQDSTRFTTSLKAKNPIWAGNQFRNFSFNSSGLFRSDTVSADLEIQLALAKNNEAKIQSSLSANLKSDGTAFIQGNLHTINFQGLKRKFTLDNPVNWQYDSNQFIMDTLLISSGNAFVKSSIILNQHHQKIDVQVNEIDFISAYSSFMSPVDAEFLTTGFFHFSHFKDSLTLASNFIISSIRVQDFYFDTLKFESEINKEKLQAKAEIIQKSKPWFLFETSVPFKLGDPTKHESEFYQRPISARIELQKTELSEYQSLYDSLQLGNISGALKANWNLTGTTENPKINSKIKFDNLLLNNVLIDSIRASTNYDPVKNRLLLTGFVNSLGRKVAELDGYLPLYLDLKNHRKILPKDTDSFSLRAKANEFDLSTVNDLLDEKQFNRLKGLLKVDLGLKGSIGKPQFDGYFRIEKGSFELIKQKIVLRDIETDLDFDRQSINLKTFSMKSNTGTAKLTGKIISEKLQPKQLELNLTAKNFQVSDTKNLKMKLNSNLKISGGIDDLDLTGTISATSADVYLENFGGKSVEIIELENKESNQEFVEDIFKGLHANIKISANNDVWVRNREYPELSVELYGEARLVKQKKEDFQMFGEFNSRRGYAKQFSKRFNLDKGQFVFNGDLTNPILDIETSYVLRQPQDVKIWYIIDGSVNEPKFTFKSEPNMELEDIVSYTIFGRPFAALLGWQQGIAGKGSSNSSTSDAAVGLLLDQVESYATEKLGVDVIEIDNSASSSGAGTSVRAGKYINQRTFVAIVQQLGGSDPVSQVVIEYLIRNNLDLVITQSSDDRSGVDLRWRYEY